MTLERAYEVFVRGRRKFRVGSLVFVAFSDDEEIIEFGFPKEERDGLIASDPDTFSLPSQSDLRFNWVRARMDRLDPAEAREFVVEAWRMCVAPEGGQGLGRGAS
nr:MmcQ/YjbR family DNA-binding protein [Ornithinimicrobium sp. F0845]